MAAHLLVELFWLAADAMRVFVTWICTCIYQMTFLTVQVPICVLWHLITSNHILFFPRLFIFPESPLPSLQLPIFTQIVPTAMIGNCHWLQMNLKIAFGDLLCANSEITKLWKMSSWCWAMYPACNEVHMQADPRNQEPLWGHWGTSSAAVI